MLMTRSYLLHTLLALSCVQQFVGAIIADDLRSLNLSAGTQIDPPSNFTKRWSSYHSPDYKVTVIPATDHDVSAIVWNIPLTRPSHFLLHMSLTANL